MCLLYPAITSTCCRGRCHRRRHIAHAFLPSFSLLRCQLLSLCLLLLLSRCHRLCRHLLLLLLLLLLQQLRSLGCLP